MKPSPKPSIIYLMINQKIAQILLLTCMLILTSCKDIPRDSYKTLENIKTNKLLKVGVVQHPPWVDEIAEQPSGREVDIVEKFAKHLNSNIKWVKTAEHKLVEQLVTGKIDLLIGGFTTDTVWQDQVALTRPYFIKDHEEHVFLAQPGENAFIVELEQFLKAQNYVPYS